MTNPIRRGFTLIELLVVIAILAIMAAIIFPIVNRMIEVSAPAVQVLVKVEKKQMSADDHFVQTIQKKDGRVVTEIMTADPSTYNALQEGHYYQVDAKGKATEGEVSPPYRKLVKVKDEVPETAIQ